MAQERGSNLFKNLTRLFRSGPVVKRKVRSPDSRVAGPDLAGQSSSVLLLSKTQVGNFNSIISGGQGYVTQERMSRLQDFNEMDAYAEINAACDIYADESVAQDANGKSLHIHSDNPAIKKCLEELFYNTLNAEFNLRPWSRNLVKYGDFYLYVDVSPDYGVINVVPIPVNELTREEGFDPKDPLAVRFRWMTLGNRTLENWEIAHFRLLGNDQYLPYGSSMLDGARRIWRQLVLIEDAMLVYRVTRSPERRVFYVDVGGVSPDEIANYMESAKANIKSSQVVDRATGRVDMRYNPLPVRRDTPVPLLDGRTLTIEEMAKEHDAGKINWVYSVQDGTSKLVPGKVVWCGKNYTADKLARVWLDDGTYVDAAGEHPFVLRDGSSKRADELEPGQALMPLYKRTSKLGYEQCYDPSSGAFVMTHAMVARDVYPREWAIFKRSTLEDTQQEPVGYLNHKVDRVEWIDGDDVFCMTVVGSNGEEDRHNFAANARNQDQTVASNSMIMLRNSVEEDYWIPVRGDQTSTRIDTLQAGQNTGNVEDVQYIQKKLIAALKVPAAYLGYNDAIPGSSGLAQVDIRFSRTVNMIQRTIVSELNKIAMVHLYAAGFRGEDLIAFEIRLSNPSTIAQQQKLELLRTRFEIAGTAPLIGETPLMSERWIQRNVMGLNDQEILQNKRERLDDVRAQGALEAAGVVGGGEGEGAEGGAGAGEGGEASAPEGEGAPAAGLETASDHDDEADVLTASPSAGDVRRVREDDAPVKLAPGLKNALYNRRRSLRRRTHGVVNVLDRAVSGATARPSVPEARNLHEAFQDVLDEAESDLTLDQSALLKQDAALSQLITVRPVVGQAEVRMLRELSFTKKLDVPDPEHWDSESTRERVLLEHFAPPSSEAADPGDLELYDEEGAAGGTDS